MNTEEQPTWYVVTSQKRRVIAVYGPTLLEEAREWAETLTRSTALTAHVETVVGPKPSVGDQL